MSDKFSLFRGIQNSQRKEIIAFAKESKQPSQETANLFLARNVIEGEAGSYSFKPRMKELILEYEKGGFAMMDRLKKMVFSE